MKILTDDHWELIIGHQEWLKARVKELEQQISGLLDRLLIEKGQIPLNMSLREDIREQEKEQQDLAQVLLAEEIGEEPKDASD